MNSRPGVTVTADMAVLATEINETSGLVVLP